MQQVPAEPLDQRERSDHADHQPDDHGGQGQPGVQRREALAELGEQRHAQEQTAEGTEERHEHHHAAEVAAVGQQAGLDQRVTAATALPDHEGHQQRHTDAEQDEGPRRPPVGLALDQRVDDRGQGGTDQHHAHGVQAHAGTRDGARQDPDGGHEAGDADRDVDQEHQPPADVPQVGVDEHTGQDRRGQGGQGEHGAEQTEHLGHLVVVERLFDHADALRDHQRAEGALQHPAHDEHADRRSRGADRGHDGEAGRSDQEQPAASEHVPEPGAGDEEDGERERVAGAEPLQGRVAAAERRADGRSGDVDDRRIHQVHHVGHDDNEEDEPAQRVTGGGRRGVGRGVLGQVKGGHGVLLSSPLKLGTAAVSRRTRC